LTVLFEGMFVNRNARWRREQGPRERWKPPRLAGEARRPVLPVYGYQRALDRLLRDLRVEKA
jgi:hypothetical protein